MRRRMDRALDLIHAADGPVYVKKRSNHVGPGPYPCVAAWIRAWTYIYQTVGGSRRDSAIKMTKGGSRRDSAIKMTILT